MKLRLLAPAKVNLTLEVLGRRSDGYHELASVMATVDLYDDVRVAPARAIDVRIRPPVGAERGDDLASRAARAIAAACGREPNLHVNIRKRIPVAAGLGGGSSDAAAVLGAVARLWSADVDVVRVAADVGSDVPFFAAGHPVARIGGRGEVVEALPAPRHELWISLVILPVRLATKDVFAALERADGDGRATDDLANAVESGAVTAATIRALARNDLTTATERASSRVAEARAAARAKGIDLHVSGSGPSLFAVADDRAHALHMSKALRRIGLRARSHRIAVTS